MRYPEEAKQPALFSRGKVDVEDPPFDYSRISSACLPSMVCQRFVPTQRDSTLASYNYNILHSYNIVAQNTFIIWIWCYIAIKADSTLLTENSYLMKVKILMIVNGESILSSIERYSNERRGDHGYNCYGCCRDYHFYHYGFDCHYHKENAQEEIHLCNFRPAYRATCRVFPCTDYHIIHLKQLDVLNP